ncbi:MAG: glutamine-hydrolyzing GMP synthase [Proteobacteria bacterium]|nr:glutamine-hydrolyzing GMP synthase [Pseudomonadota bacterium]
MYQSRPHDEGLCVVDFGSQYTRLIARKLRENHIYCEIFPPSKDSPRFSYTIKGVVLSGGPDSVASDLASPLPSWVLNLGVPVLGICYGMQLLVKHFGGVIHSGVSREYGRASITYENRFMVDNLVTANSPVARIWQGLSQNHTVWMSHGDHIAQLPPVSVQSGGFEVVGRTARTIAACASCDGKVIGLQYHPEVKHTEGGSQLLSNFARHVCGVASLWQPNSMLDTLTKALQAQVLSGEKILVACSGGVDSTVTLVLLTQIFGKDRVQGVFVNTGLLRLDDAHKMAKIAEELCLSVHQIPAESLFYQKLAGVSHPEEKRKIIGATFVDVFTQFALERKTQFSYLAQGTLYSDVIESGDGGTGPQVIKTHHNVGGLPERLPFKILEPLRFLFKDEVRMLGAELGIDREILWQHPFPGPGLGVRIAGEVTEQRVKILQQADQIYIDFLKEKNIYHEIWQAFCVLLPVKSVGVMGDERTYEWVVSLRAVNSTDAMTAMVANIQMADLTTVAEKIISTVQGVNRVLYDITTKPPATIEWE